MATVFINEIHYDNAGTDTGEAIEIAGPAGTDLTGWSLVLYNGTGGAAYNTRTLSGVIPDQQDGFGTLFFSYPSNGIQNGEPDGIALVNPGNIVVQFLSYEGAFSAVGGPANGMMSTDIGVSETGSEPTMPVVQSLQLRGTGDDSEDFTWSSAAPNTFNAVNTGQTFMGGGGGDTPIVSIVSTDPAAAEAGADSGTFTISRTGDMDAALTVEYISIGTAANDADYTPTLTGTATIAAGESSVDITITPIDDDEVEGNEVLGLSLQDNTTYDLNPTTDDATVTIADNDTDTPPPPVTRIRDIQGTAHISSLNGQTVTNVPGIVTVVRSNGFYLQDPTSDTDDRTSEGIFVFTSSPPGVSAGDSILVSGAVSEFRPGGSSGTNNLSITQIGGNPTIQTLSSGNPLPIATIIGTGGRTPPTEIIDNDTNGSVENPPQTQFDPGEDGIDFYESLEGMLVQVNNAVAVGPTNDFGEIPVLVDNGANAGPRTARDGIYIQPGDFNPERIIIDDAIVGPSAQPDVNVRDQFSQVTGVIDYSFSNFKLLNTTPLTATLGGLARETTNLTKSADQLTVATFNVENLDPGDGSIKFNRLANAIVNNLQAPDIISLEEIQDNNGPTNDSEVDANQTYQTLIDAIELAGGPTTYEYRQINPVDDQDGGEPGGNIRVGFLFNNDRVDFLDRPGGGSTTNTTVTSGDSGPELSSSVGRILDTDLSNGDAFASSRKPVVGEFLFNDNKVFVIGNHFNSKGGDQPLFGRFQPPALISEAQRLQQAAIVNDFVESILAIDPNANVVAMGDFNDFQFSDPIATLKGDDLNNLFDTLPANERYTYVFEGNSQVLDHILVSDNLLNDSEAELDVVHINSEFADQVSDHDPLVGRFTLAAPPLSLSINDVTVPEGDLGSTTATFTIALNRASSQSFTVNYATADGSNNNAAIAPGDYAAESDTVEFMAGDTSKTISIEVRGDLVDEPDETFFVNLSNATGNATIADPQGVGTIRDDDTANVQMGDGTNETFVTSPETDIIDAKGGNDKVLSRYRELQQNDQIEGGLGRDTFVLSAGTADDSVSIEVDNANDQLQGPIPDPAVSNFEIFNLSQFTGTTTFTGSTSTDSSKRDSFQGGAGNDVATGNGGNDFLRGGDGNDTLNGGDGNDFLDGATGTDTMIGGAGNDTYIVGSTTDVVSEVANSSLDSVRSSASFTLSDNIENLTLVGNSAINGTGNAINNTLIGNGANNTLRGGDGADTLLGSAGNDQLVGGKGSDTLTGSLGVDRFIFNSRTEGKDTITDFTVADDRIDVSRAGFGGGLMAGTITTDQFRTGVAAADAEDRFIYTRSTGALFFDQDGTGSIGKVQFATLDTGLNMTHNDIFVSA